MTPSPQSVDTITLPTDSTVPVVRRTEYDAYFRITRSDEPARWAISALDAITAVTTDLPTSTLTERSRIDLIDALALVVVDASASIKAPVADTRRPADAPTTGSPATPIAPTVEAARALGRWKRGHHVFHLFVIGMNSRLNAILSALRCSDWNELEALLSTLGVLYRGATASMEYASDFAPEVYRDYVRPSMEPPWLEPGFSAVFNNDHALMLDRVRLLRKALKSTDLPAAAAASARELWKSQAHNRRAHQLICQKFVPGGDSLLQEHFDSTNQND